MSQVSYEWDPSGMVASASGVGLAVLGLLVLTVRPRRAPVYAFSLFTLLWGAQIVAANMLFRLAPAHTLVIWAYVMLASLMVMHAPLLYFASTYPWTTGRGARAGWWSLVALSAIGLLLLLLLATEPDLFISAVATSDGERFVPGPWFWPVSVAVSPVSFIVALCIVALKWGRAQGEGARDQLALVCAAFLLYVSYLGSTTLHFVFLPLSDWQVDGWFSLRAGADLLALAATAVVLVAVWRSRDSWRDLLLMAGLVPFIVGLTEAVLRAVGVPWIDTAGVWRLGMVGIFVYAVSRHRLFDADLRIRSLTGVGAYAGAVVVLAGVFWSLWGRTLAPSLLAIVVIGIMAVCLPVVRVVGRAVGPGRGEDPEYLLRRKMAVYLAALEEAAARDGTDDRHRLPALRKDLGISSSQHRELMGRLFPASVDDESVRSDSRYEVMRELGRGSMGRAVLARDRVLDRLVVLKEAFVGAGEGDDARQRFLREARMMARIQHPNIVCVHEVLDQDPPALVLEYVEGGSLMQALEAQGCLPVHRAVSVACDLLVALGRLHDEGIVHRDLKPANVLLDADGNAKVADFGVARAPMSGEETLAAPGHQPGSISYMSPEQARGGPVDARSDLYSIGVILYESLTGEPPYDLRGRQAQGMRAVVQTTPARLPAPGVPAALEPVLRRALEKSPSRRFADADSMRLALEQAAREVSADPELTGGA